MPGEKTYAVEIRDNVTFLHVRVSGEKATPEIVLAYWREIREACDSRGCRKILLEHDFVEMIGMQEMLTIIGPVGEMLKDRVLAFYDRFGQYETPEAGKVILRGRAVKMQIFHDLKEAERWLLAN